MRVRVVCRRVMLDNVVSLGCGKVVCDKVVCVCTICIDVKLHFTAGGHRGPRGSVANEDTPWVPVKTYLLYNIYIYVYIDSPAPGRI